MARIDVMMIYTSEGKDTFDQLLLSSSIIGNTTVRELISSRVVNAPAVRQLETKVGSPSTAELSQFGNLAQRLSATWPPVCETHMQ